MKCPRRQAFSVVRAIIPCLVVCLLIAILVGCSPKPQALVLIDPYLSGLLSNDDIARWQAASSSEGVSLELVHLHVPEDGGSLFDQMRSALESGDSYQFVFVTPALLREAELLAELDAEYLPGAIVVLGGGEDNLAPGLSAVVFDRVPAYRQLGELLVEGAETGVTRAAGSSGAAPNPNSSGDEFTDLILFFALDTPAARSAAAALDLEVGSQLETKELWYTTVPDHERLRQDLLERRTPNSIAVFSLGLAGPAALSISKELALATVFEAGGSEYEHVIYSIEFPFEHALAAAVRGDNEAPAVVRSGLRSVSR